MNILDYDSFYLVGIKGVAMASLAQCLLDAKKQVTGCDVEEKFVTQELLDERHVRIDIGFANNFPPDIDCVVYTAAHQGKFNPQIVKAQQQGLPVFTQAEAVASLFNQKKGLAVCGVGGKSTTSAMIAWILEKTGRQPSFSVGVGNIPGLNKTGQWSLQAEYFVAEADEYVVDASAPSRGEEITPRFSFMEPFITVCTNLKFDHPDVYRDFEHTLQVYKTFFTQIKPNGFLVINADDEKLVSLTSEVKAVRPDITVLSFGQQSTADLRLKDFQVEPGKTLSTLQSDAEHRLELMIPGQYNAYNALAALCATTVVQVLISDAISALKTFQT